MYSPNDFLLFTKKDLCTTPNPTPIILVVSGLLLLLCLLLLLEVLTNSNCLHGLTQHAFPRPLYFAPEIVALGERPQGHTTHLEVRHLGHRCVAVEHLQRDTIITKGKYRALMNMFKHMDPLYPHLLLIHGILLQQVRGASIDVHTLFRQRPPLKQLHQSWHRKPTVIKYDRS